jgi:hypothetical protein
MYSSRVMLDTMYPAATVDSLPHFVNFGPIGKLIRVGVSNPTGTYPLHYATICSPVHRILTQGVICSIVKGTCSASTDTSIMDVLEVLEVLPFVIPYRNITAVVKSSFVNH